VIEAQRGKRDPNLTLSYARKWGPVFGAPTQILMTLAHNESGHNPFMRDPSASGKGGAWGLMAQMANEAGSKVKRILGTWGHLPAVHATAKKWTGRPEDLWDPDLNMMISSWQVGKLVRKFGPRIDVVAAGYHQGEGAVGRRIAAGKPAIDPKLQPKGAVYVARAEKVLPLYRGVA
jgi:soluble lytic murein transglycosylase-like protein